MPRQPPTELKRDHNSAFVRWNGEKIYFGRWGSREASKAFAKWLSEVSDHPSAPATQSRITVTECVELYLIHARNYYPDGEFKNVSAAMSALVEFAGDDLAIEFGPRLLKDLQRALSQAIGDDGESLRYARNTVNARIERVRRCFRWCASEELIPVAVVTALETVQGLAKGRGAARETNDVAPVPLEVVIATIPFLSPTVGYMAIVQYLCGMRPQDVCRMTGDAIDMTGEVWLYRPLLHKGSHRGQSLVKAIPKAAQDIIKPLLRADPSEPIFSPYDTLVYFNNLPKNARRTFYDSNSYGKSIRQGIQKAAKRKVNPVTVPHWSPNQLRHAIGTELRRTLGIEAAQAYLGHAKIDATLIYAEQTECALREIARSIVLPVALPKPERESRVSPPQSP